MVSMVSPDHDKTGLPHARFFGEQGTDSHAGPCAGVIPRLLAVSAELAGQRARSRAESEPGRARDSYERDDELQQRTGAVYAGLAAAGWGGRWLVVDADVDPGGLAATLTGP